MISIAIVEDQKEFADTLNNYIQRYKRESHEPIETTFFSDGKAFLEQYVQGYHIVFMDILMPNMNGLEAAHQLREIDQKTCLIFITNLAQYAIRGYEVHALDYLIKPLPYDLFKIKLEKAIAHIKVETVYLLTSPEGTRKIVLSELRYIESSKHYLYFHLADGVYRMRGSLKDICPFFEANGFARPGGSLLVNLSYVEKVGKNTVSVGGEQLPLAKKYAASFWGKLTAQFSGGN